MIIRKFLLPGISVLALVLSLHVHAGNLYRFIDENGVKTLSRSLPPDAAQRGYDILDDKSMRLIERVPPAPTAEEIAEMKRREQQEAEAMRQAEIEAGEAEKRREEQARHDHTLLTTYQSEQDLLRARDHDISYRQTRIEAHRQKLAKLERDLIKFQQEAAERELSGGNISPNLQKKLNAVQQEIGLRTQAIAQLEDEIDTLSTKYESDLQRLHELLQARAR
jgi:hypothetical protein